MESLQLSQVWSAATVLVGFQIVALSWRIKRELEMEDEDEPTWITIPDVIVAVSLFTLAFGVFTAPLMGSISTSTAAKMFGLSLVLFISAPFVLAGHYNLYCDWGKTTPRDQVTKQETAAIAFAALLVAAYGIWWVLT